MNPAVFLRFIGMLALLSGSCRPGDGPEPSAPGGGDSYASPPGVNIYLLADQNIDLEAARACPLAELVLQKKPWIAAQDIERYDFSSHCLYLKGSVLLPRQRVSLRGTPFVMTADGQRCYLGALWSMISSFLPERSTPLIHTWGIAPPDVVFVELMSIRRRAERQVQDVRGDPRIVQALVRKGQYHAGLSLSLDRVEVQPRQGGASIRYTYTLQNKDTDNLYVFDPNRMGADLFRHFNPPPWLLPRAGGNAVAPVPGGAANHAALPDEWDARWFSHIKSGESMTWTVVAEDYPKITPGGYECFFHFHSPGENATRDRRTRPEGRVWMGETEAKLTVEVGQNGQNHGERSNSND
jgi:hypothetical protein